MSSVSFELYSPAGMYEVSNFSESEILKVHLSFNKAHNFSGEKCGPHLPFLGAAWKFCKNPIKPRFIFVASSTSFTDDFFYVAQFSVLSKQLYYLWSMIFGC